MTQEPRSEQALPHTVLTYLPYYLKVSLGIPMCVQRETSSSDDQSREPVTQGTVASLQNKKGVRNTLTWTSSCECSVRAYLEYCGA